jgi:pyruvate formate lyase activating enzyme
MKEALLYESSKSGLVKCFVCPHECNIFPLKKNFLQQRNGLEAEIKKENLGFCGTRINLSGKLYTLNYGRITSLEVEPIEKKLLYHFLPGTLTLSVGSFGCSFRCPNCYNWEISQTSSLVQSKPETVFQLNQNFPEVSPTEIVTQAIENRCTSISYTYNEPTVSLEFNLKTMNLARKAKIKNIWITNGFIGQKALDLILPYLDAVNLDIKSLSEKFYSSHSKGSLTPVLKNLLKIRREKIHIEISTLVIPGLNEKNEILNLADFIKEKVSPRVPFHLVDFSAPISWQMEKWAEPEKKDLLQLWKKIISSGMEFVYSDVDNKTKNTYCPHCGELNIERFDYEIERKDDDGFCFNCDRKLFIRE